MKNKILALSAFILMLLIYNIPMASASTSVGVTPIESVSQSGQYQGYFNLKMKPKQTEKLSFKVSNAGDKEKSVNVGIHNAATNKQMQVEYGNGKLASTKQRPVDLDKAIKGPRLLTLKPHSTQEIHYTLTMPDKEFIGIISGGFTFSEVDNDAHSESKQQNVNGVQNKYSYVIGLVAMNNDKLPKPKLEMTGVQMDQWNDRNAINMSFDAESGNFIKDLATKITVTNIKNKEVVLEKSEKNHAIAPYSQFDWVVPLGEQRKWDSGDYLVKVSIGNKKDKWTFEKTLTVTDKQAKEYNAKDVSLSGNWWVYLPLIAVCIAALAGIIYILKNKKASRN